MAIWGPKATAATASRSQRSPTGATTVRLAQYRGERWAPMTCSEAEPRRCPRWAARPTGGAVSRLRAWRTTAVSSRTAYQVSAVCLTVWAIMAATARPHAASGAVPVAVAPAARPA